MTSSDEAWQVLPHGALNRLEENLWWLQGSIKTVPLPRSMTVVRLQNGDAVLHNAIAISEPLLEQLQDIGPLAWIVVPSRYHRIDAARYKARFPNLRVICPNGSTPWVTERVAVDADFDAANALFVDDPTISLQHLVGTSLAEGVVTARSANGVTLIFNDALYNLESNGGLFWFIYGVLLGHAGRPQIPKAFRWVLLKDKEAFRSQIYDLADTPGLCRVIPGHGNIIDNEPRETLRRVADTLG